MPRILVIGAGAIGSALAADLALAGADVTLVTRGARLAWLAAHPLELERGGEVLRVPVAASAWSGIAGPVDLALMCTKMADLPGALVPLGQRLAGEGIVVTVQNGVEAPDLAARSLAHGAIVAGRVHGFFEMAGHRVRHVGVAPSVEFGCVRGGAAPVERRLEQILARTGFAPIRAADIVRSLWLKLVLSASLGGVALAMDVPAGSVCRTPEGQALLRRAMDEVRLVARHHGVTIDESDLARIQAFVRAFPDDATTSLQRDVNAGAPSEHDAITGAIVRLAAAKGVAVPVFTGIARCIEARIAQAGGPDARETAAS
ncbi:MAG: 2-dehydropantoate 2-reductase [Sphingomonadales bacterium]|nr:2-dehydropantoate 2-reductase [Sphingomonadales bacterium]